MQSQLVSLVTVLALGVHIGSAAETEKPGAPPTQVTVRMRFVPGGPPAKGSSDFKGASCTSLVPGPEKGVLWCQAHAGVGDQFPVITETGEKLFDVLLAEGDDDHVVLDIRSKEGVKRINLPRDKAGSVEVAGIKYGLSYPSVSVAAAPNDKPTTNKAMLMVTRHL
jgi:hypothetical protein